MKQLIFVALGALLLTGCAARHTRPVAVDAMPAQVEREARLASVRSWGFDGRIVVVDDGRTGSGRITWRRDGERLEITLSAPVSRSSWRLVADRDSARLDGHEDGPLEAPDAETLLEASVGWSVPLPAIEAWARGARWGARGRPVFGDDGLPEELDQRGWNVRFRDWYHDADPPLPRRVFAERGDTRLRLVVDRWLDGAAVAGASRSP